MPDKKPTNTTELIIPIIVPHIRSDNASEELESIYTIRGVLGQGAFGVVNLAINKTTKEKFACKILKKRIGSTSAYEQQEREVAIMKQVDHENILRLHAVYESPSNLYLVMEL
jgi:calcium/calmodulin-dependent protein kinase I